MNVLKLVSLFDIYIKMRTIQQLKQRRMVLRKTLKELERLTDIDKSVISNTLNGKRDSRLSTVEALAGALNASLMVVPNHILPEVLRLLSGKTVGPDDVPTAVERILAGE